MFFNTHKGREENILKKLTVVYIQNGLTLGYTIQILNLYNSHSFSNNSIIFSFENTKYFNIHMGREEKIF